MLEKITEYGVLDYSSRREFILDTLSSLGADPTTQEIYHEGSKFVNIFGKLGKKDNHPVPAFSAHYDKTPEGDGVLDNGAAVIEILSALEEMVKKGHNPLFGFVFFDGEEVGLIGSKGYVKEPVFKVSEVYNLEVTGNGDSVLIGEKSYDRSWQEYISNSSSMNQRVQQVCTQLSIPFFYAGTPPSDNMILNSANIKSTVFSTVSNDLGKLWESEGGPTSTVLKQLDINGEKDTLDKIQLETLQMVKNIILNIVELY